MLESDHPPREMHLPGIFNGKSKNYKVVSKFFFFDLRTTKNFQKFVNTWLKTWRGVFGIWRIQASAEYNTVFTTPYLRAPADGARPSNYTKWQTKVASKQFGAKEAKMAPEAPKKEKWHLWRLRRKILKIPNFLMQKRGVARGNQFFDRQKMWYVCCF